MLFNDRENIPSTLAKRQLLSVGVGTFKLTFVSWTMKTQKPETTPLQRILGSQQAGRGWLVKSLKKVVSTQ